MKIHPRTSWALALLLVAGRLAAQPAERPPRVPSRVPVTVAMVERLPYPDAPFIIVREASGGDFILLPQNADAAVLTDAVNAMLLARQRGGDRARADAVLRVRAPERARGARPLPWAARVLADVRTAPPRPVPRVGVAPAIQIWLPSPAAARRMTAP